MNRSSDHKNRVKLIKKVSNLTKVIANVEEKFWVLRKINTSISRAVLSKHENLFKINLIFIYIINA